MAESAEVVIVGGGIVGCATAYFLAKQGVRATLLEREAVGSCASGFAAGLLNPLNGVGIPGPLEPLTLESYRMHLGLTVEVKAETGIDPESRDMSCIWLAFDEAETAEFDGRFQLAERVDSFSGRRLDTRELASLEPRISPQVVGAMCLEHIRQVSSYQYTMALATAAEKHGATVRQATVRGLTQANGRVSGVLLNDGQISSDRVIIAMGPWTGEVTDWLGLAVPVGPLKGQIVRLDLPGSPLKHVLYRSGGGYIAPKPDGTIWTGTTEERVGFDNEPTPEARQGIMKAAIEVMPALADAKVVLQTACLRPVSEDGLPIIGGVPGWDGLYLATGAGRKGILLAPAMAQAVVDLVVSGRTDHPIGAFSPGRFSTGQFSTG